MHVIMSFFKIFGWIFFVSSVFKKIFNLLLGYVCLVFLHIVLLFLLAVF